MKQIGVITSGGDAPGMNAAVRAVVRAAIHRGVAVSGFIHGYQGILDSEIVPLDSVSVRGILNQGGTILRTARCKPFLEKSGRETAVENLRRLGIEGLIVIGGDGSLTGARCLHEEFQFPVIGVPGSIDNDIGGTDYSIGFDTAVNTALDALDRVRDTAGSHERVFVIEVMGRRNGFIAVEVGLAGGADAVMIPEIPTTIPDVAEQVRKMYAAGKRSSIIVVAEGAAKASDVNEYLREHTEFESRYLVLGHMQRGGSPTAFDRVLSMRLADRATNLLLSGYSGEMVGVEGFKLTSHPLNYVLSRGKTVDPEKLRLVEVLRG